MRAEGGQTTKHNEPRIFLGSRTFLLMMAGTDFGQNDALYGLHRGFHPKLGVTRNMAKWFALSGLIIVPGLIFWGMGGIKKSIEFTGGTEISGGWDFRSMSTSQSEVPSLLWTHHSQMLPSCEHSADSLPSSKMQP